jgi:hypothetical protein
MSMHKSTHQSFEEAFVEAYGQHVASADKETVQAFIQCINEDLDADQIHNSFPFEYTGMMDAIGVFGEGCDFAKKQVAAQFIATLENLKQCTSNELVITDGLSFNIDEVLQELKRIA